MDTLPILVPPVLNLVSAIAVGVLIGAERERRKGEGPARSPVGLRTFAIASTAGAVAFSLGGVALLAVIAASVAGLLAVSYGKRPHQDPGLTTEIVLLLTVLLGGLCIPAPQMAAAIAVTVTVLLHLKAWLHTLVTTLISKDELDDALIFAAATLVILPLVPDRPMGPWLALNPHSLGIVILLVMAIGAAGYLAVRLFGARFGLPLSGALSGFVSSTATIGAMGARALQSPEMRAACVAGAVLSTVATVLQMGLVLAAVSLPTLRQMILPLVLAGVTAVAYGVVLTLVAMRHPAAETPGPGSAFSLKTALIFGSVLALVLILAAGLQAHFGGSGVLLAATAAGLVDTHASAISVATLVAAGKVAPEAAAVPILAGLSANTVTKILVATISGGRGFALRVVPGLVLVILAAWAGSLLM
ncbi:MgtC/SapB family protein [Rhodobacter capsulatus]|uniref:MgtC/SapB family protein n=1 Tax=Rhodobacter capsulatus TaxID=1061 RepID=UPI004024D7DA